MNFQHNLTPSLMLGNNALVPMLAETTQAYK